MIRLRYGLFGSKEHTQREIAGQLGISRSYVSRLEKRAVEKLREEFQRMGIRRREDLLCGKQSELFLQKFGEVFLE